MQILHIVPAFAAVLHTVHCAPSSKIPGNLFNPPGNVEMPTKGLPITEGQFHGNNSMTAGNNTVLIKAVSASEYFCQDSTFENRVTKASPLVDDCRTLHDNIVGSGIWTVNVFTQHRLASYKTCAFGVDANGGEGGKSAVFKVGNGDIRDLIETSIYWFHWRSDDDGIDRVGTKGYMACNPDGLSIEWGLYHT